MSEAVRNWDQLGEIPENQFSVALDIVKDSAAKWQEKYPEIHSVSVGYGEPHSGMSGNDKFCLRFEAQIDHCMPERILCYYCDKGTQRPVSIPVETYSPVVGGLHNTWPEDYFYGCGRIKNKMEREPGSACCVFQVEENSETGDGFNGLAMLSCAHVFNLVKKNNFKALANHVVFRKVPEGADQQIGTAYLSGPFIAQPDPKAYSLDAALIKLDTDIDPEILSGMTDPVPTELAEQGVSQADLYVSGAWGKDKVSFQGYVAHKIFCIAPGRYIRVRGAYMYKSQKNPDPEGIRPGYSGSPLIDAAGKIYGMHFYGAEPDKNGDTFGYALPIMDVLSFFEDNYGLKMELATSFSP